MSTEEQDLTRQAEVEEGARLAGYYVAGVYREKAAGARVNRPELQRKIHDLQSGEVVVAEKIDRISRLPLPEAEKLVDSIRARGAKLAIPGLVDLSELAAGASGVAKIVLESVQELLLKLALQTARETTRRGASASGNVSSLRRRRASTRAAHPMSPPIKILWRFGWLAKPSNAPQS